MKRFQLVIAFLVLSYFTFGQYGYVDTTFNTFDDGYWGNGNDLYFSMDIEELPNGQFIVAGFGQYDGQGSHCLVRVHADGAADTSFVTEFGNLYNNLILNSVEIQSDGKIIVVGETYSGTALGFMARLNPDGSFDNSFVNGFTFDDNVYDVIVQPDGKIIVVGKFQNYNGSQANKILRLNSDGSIDPSFFISPTPDGASAYIRDVELTSTGQILVCGDFSSINGAMFNSIAKFNSDGTEDPVFIQGSVNNDVIMDLEILSNNSIMIVGSFYTHNNITRNGICKLFADGSVDITFNGGSANGFNLSSFKYPTKIIQLANGKLFVFGGENYNGQANDKGGVVINIAGGIDSGFNFDPGVSSVSAAQCVFERADGKLVMSLIGMELALINTNGSRDYSFNQQPGIDLGFTLSIDEGINVITVLADDRVLVGGFFQGYNNVSVNSIMRIEADGSYDNTFVVDSMFGTVRAIAEQSDGKYIIGGGFSLDGGVTYPRFARLNTDGSIDPTFNLGIAFGSPFPLAPSTVYAIVIQPDGKILVGGSLANYNGVGIGSLCRINPDGTLDATFQNNLIIGHVSSIILRPDGKIYVGGWETSGSLSGFVHRLQADGTIDNTFSSVCDESVSTMEIQDDGKLVVSQTGSNSIATDIVRLLDDGSIDTTFTSTFNSPGLVSLSLIHAIRILDNGKIVVAGAGNTIVPVVYYLKENGEHDTTFLVDTDLQNAFLVKAMNFTSDGRLLIGGVFYKYLGLFNNGIARLIVTDPNASLEDNKSEEVSFIHPNPATTGIHIELPRAINGELTIFDINGRKIHSSNVESDSFLTIDVSKFVRGVYFLKIIEDSSQIQFEEKFVKL